MGFILEVAVVLSLSVGLDETLAVCQAAFRSHTPWTTSLMALGMILLATNEITFVRLLFALSSSELNR